MFKFWNLTLEASASPLYSCIGVYVPVIEKHFREQDEIAEMKTVSIECSVVWDMALGVW